jgi:hypothetical protein
MEEDIVEERDDAQMQEDVRFYSRRRVLLTRAVAFMFFFIGILC